VTALLVGVGGLLLASVPAGAENVPYLIEVESYDPQPEIDTTTEIVIVLHDPADPDRPLKAPLIGPPIELRHTGGFWQLQPDFERLDDISFRARVTYPSLGNWALVAHPQVEGRSSLPDDYPTELTIKVITAPPTHTTSSGEWEAIAAVIGLTAFLFVLVVFVAKSRWRRGKPAAPSNPGDTWWSGG